MTSEQHRPISRERLVEQLYRGYGGPRYANAPLRSLRLRVKKLNWVVVVSSTKFIKRAMDIGVSLTFLVLFLPLLLMLGLLIRLEDGGPALFWQTRIGQWGREFRFPKFRSMVVDAERLKRELASQNQHGSSITFKMKSDPRITRIGRIMRKLSVDEIPQLWCVLRGDMSLVGPRPPVPIEVARYGVNDRRRLEVRPGLTCMWQVSGRGDIPFEQQVRLDAEYIDSHSTMLDIMLLLKTIPAILSGRGAY